MTSAAMSSAMMKFTLTVKDSSGKSSKFRLVSQEVFIGRSEDNDIVVNNDPKISRKQAKLILGAFGYEVHDLSDKNPMYVNGEEVKQAPLAHRTHIKIGNTQFVFEIEQPTPMSNELVNRANLPPAPNLRQRPNPSSTQKKKSAPLFKILIIAVVGFFVWVVFSDGPSKTKGVSITSDRDIEANIEAAKQLKEAAEKEKVKKNTDTLQFKQAQSAYIRGFRDYKKGLYDRSREAFQTCLSLYPDHTLCTRYLSLSTRKFNEFVQYQMILGTEYKDRNQYKSCMNSFRTVVVMVKNQSSKIYQQAKANYEACEAQLGQRF